VLRTILRPPSDVGLHDVTTIEEWHLAVCFYPYFVTGVLRKDGEGCDMEAKLKGLSKFAWFESQPIATTTEPVGFVSDVPRHVPRDKS
jgi:hypothetical protein